MKLTPIIVVMTFLFSCGRVNSGVVAHWDGNQLAGEAQLIDRAGSMHGSFEDKYSGPPASAEMTFVTSQAGLSGNYGNALTTSALNDRVNLGEVDALDFGRNDFTVSGWFQTSNSARHGRLIMHGYPGQGGFSICVFKNDGRLSFQVFGTSTNKELMSDEVLTDGSWHWFAGVVRNEMMYLYIDGALQSHSGLAYDWSSTATVNGVISVVNQDAAAAVDHLIIYDKSLTSEVDADSELIAGELYLDWQGQFVPTTCQQAIEAGYRSFADLNGDCRVNLEDLWMIAGEWLNTRNMDIPFFWQKPPAFDEESSELGLLSLSGISNSLLYDPIASTANIDEGGSGYFESLGHGTYNHAAQFVVFEDKIIVYWANHSIDENGPGQRILARVGSISPDQSSISWGNPAETIVELAPQAALLTRRPRNCDSSLISEFTPKGGLNLINGKLYVIGKIIATHGWTNDVAYHNVRSEPVPSEKWSDNWDSAQGMTWDIWWDVGPWFYQRWTISGSTIVPDSPLYIKGTLETHIEVTPGRYKTVDTLLDTYLNAAQYATAPWEFRNDVENGTPVAFTRSLVYAPGTDSLAQDGLNGLAHKTEFQRPDGTWVAVRDNLLNPGTYYSAQKENHSDYYPPAWRTNLYGGALPSARELPDGSPFIICNSLDRLDMFITVSGDGYTFDQSWHLFHGGLPADGGMFKPVGPQYFQSYVIGNNVWVVYSITKIQIGMTQIPADLLQ